MALIDTDWHWLHAQAISLYEALQLRFPSSPYVKCQLALAKYNLREFDEAQTEFESLMVEDPYRLDQVRCLLPPQAAC